MKTILMTGAAGGIGSYLRPELSGTYELRLSDRASVSALGEGERFVAADLTDLDAVCAAVDGVDGILHFGGHTSEGIWEDISMPTSSACAMCMRPHGSAVSNESFGPVPTTRLDSIGATR